MKRSGIARRTRLARSGPVKRRNVKRRQAEFARCYHSAERVAWVQAQPCVVCCWNGGCENAHVGNGGKGRKAHYTKVVPLCGARPMTGYAAITRGDGFDIGWASCIQPLAPPSMPPVSRRARRMSDVMKLVDAYASAAVDLATSAVIGYNNPRETLRRDAARAALAACQQALREIADLGHSANSAVARDLARLAGAALTPAPRPPEDTP